MSEIKYTSKEIKTVEIRERFRKDLGDISGLAASIQSVGLINPITVTANNVLVAGERRIRACQELGWTNIPVHVVADIFSAADILVAERDENTQRKEMLPSELYQLGQALEEIERPKALARQAAQSFGRLDESNSGSSEPKLGGGRTNEIVAEAIGMSREQYKRLKALHRWSDDQELPQDLRDDAEGVLEKLDLGEVSLATEYFRLNEIVKKAHPERQKRTAGFDIDWDLVRQLAKDGQTSHQVSRRINVSRSVLVSRAKNQGIAFHADAMTNTRFIDSLNVIEKIVAGLEATQSSLEIVTFENVTRDQADEWLQRLVEPIRAINAMKNNLKEIN